MDPTTQRHILIIDRWEKMYGDLVAFVLQRMRGDQTQLVVGATAGLEAIQADPPDAVFMYLWALDAGAIEFCHQIKALPHIGPIPVIVWGAMAPPKICPQLKQADVTGYLYQPSITAEVLAARDAAVTGETYFPGSYAYYAPA